MQSRLFAWDKVSFRAPVGWEIALYNFRRGGVARLELEDDVALRMEMEWVRPRRKVDMKGVLARYEKSIGKLAAKADRKTAIESLPVGWFATLYVFRETVPDGETRNRGLAVRERRLVTAFYLCPKSTLFAYVIIRFAAGDAEDPAAVTRLVASEFTHHTGPGLVPWSLFDISFKVPHDFVLEGTRFGIGAKMMVFRSRLRRFHVWYMSCADAFLKEGAGMETWVAGYLNSYAGIKGAVFMPGSGGDVPWKRRGRYPLGHADEITRWCFKYKVRCRLDTGRNMLVFWVFSHRRPADLDMIPPDFRF